MAECIDRGKSLDYRNSMPNGRCSGCHGKYLAARIDPDAKAKVTADHQSRAPKTSSVYQERIRNTKIDAILVTTAHTLQGIEVTKYLGFVSTECAYGMNMFKDMFANVRNLVGGRSTAVEDTMRDSREAVLLELKREAYAKGANAVIAVDLDYTQLGAGGNMMVLVTASGTAVVIEAKEGAL
jgi:uncharacterized protein YbjQ (UPF0145 family)